jgi:7-cyano-7-deazaguanine synthase
MNSLVLFSGGLDSTVILANMVRDRLECSALTFDYGQRNVIEVERAEQIAQHYNVPHEIITLLDIAVAKADDVVWAGRNLIFASIAVGIAQARGFNRVVVGCNGSDWARFPDCRPPFWTGLDRIARDAYSVAIEAPLMHYSKNDVVLMARKLEVPIDLTWSCYEPVKDFEHGGQQPCGQCLACETRKAALQWSASA